MSAPASPCGEPSPAVTPPGSPMRSAVVPEVRAAAGVSVRAGLSVTGRPGRRGRATRGVPCERCQNETCGSLQLPCGRLVILCETCALEFYDVLIKKIAKFESHFEEFLLEQQDKKEGTTAQSATRVESPAWPGNAGSTGTTTHDVEQRTPQPGELAPHRRPGTSSSPERRRSDFFGGVSKQKGEFPSSPSTPSRDDMIVTRGEYKGGLSGMLDPRRRTTSRHVNSPGVVGLGGVATSIGQAANFRVMNGRSQRPATVSSANIGEGTVSRDDRFALAHGTGKPYLNSSSGNPRVKVSNDSNGVDQVPPLGGSKIKSLNGDGHDLSGAFQHDLFAEKQSQARRGYGSQQATAKGGLDSQDVTMGTPPTIKRSNSMKDLGSDTWGMQGVATNGISALSDQPRLGRQRMSSDTASDPTVAAISDKSTICSFFSNPGWTEGEGAPSVTKCLPSGGSPLRRGGGSWGRNADSWSQPPPGPGTSKGVPDFVRSSAVMVRSAVSAHGTRASNSGAHFGRDIEGSAGLGSFGLLGRYEKNPIARVQNSSYGTKDWSSGLVGNGAQGRLGVIRDPPSLSAGAPGSAGGDCHSDIGHGRMGGTPPRRNGGLKGANSPGAKGSTFALDPLGLGIASVGFSGAERTPHTATQKQRQPGGVGSGGGKLMLMPGSGAANTIR